VGDGEAAGDGLEDGDGLGDGVGLTLGDGDVGLGVTGKAATVKEAVHVVATS